MNLFLHLPILRKALKQVTKVSVLRDQRNLLQNYVLGCLYPFVKITCILTFSLPFQGSFSELSERLCLRL